MSYTILNFTLTSICTDAHNMIEGSSWCIKGWCLSSYLYVVTFSSTTCVPLFRMSIENSYFHSRKIVNRHKTRHVRNHPESGQQWGCVTDALYKLLNMWYHSQEHTLISPYLAMRGHIKKNVTASVFFHCPTVRLVGPLSPVILKTTWLFCCQFSFANVIRY